MLIDLIAPPWEVLWEGPESLREDRIGSGVPVADWEPLEGDVPWALSGREPSLREIDLFAAIRVFFSWLPKTGAIVVTSIANSG